MNLANRPRLFDVAMTVIGIVTVLIACQHLCRGDEPVITWPRSPAFTEPIPPPVPDARDIDTLRADEWLVVESSVELFVRRFPEDIIDVESTTGPIRVRGKFAGGTGKIETREYRTAYVYFLTTAKNGVVGVDLVPVGVTAETSIARHVLTVVDGTQPNPPPKPDPGPGPTPEPPKPDPITPQKLQIVIIEDMTARGTAEQISIIDGGDLREYCKTHCVMTSQDGYRFPDARHLSFRQDVSNQPEWIRTAFSQPRTSLPWLVVFTPTQTISGPLPATIEDMMSLLRKYGGQ